MRGGKTLRSARVTVALSQGEKDQLSRSMKKDKTNVSQETMVEETPNLGVNDGEKQGEDAKQDAVAKGK
ncbi:hypothetical protein SESBI_40415 [Sesbania bispinosa]|nr:hypothetical protein SESBI_40415 [Sesbania bispinosa]